MPGAARRWDPRGRARADLVWYLRHASALARWAVLPEEWARRIEAGRRAGHPGAAPEGRHRGGEPAGGSRDGP